MTLNYKEYALFLRVHLALLHYAGMAKGLISSNATEKAFYKLNPEKKGICREALHKHPELLDEFLKNNSAQLNEDEIEVVQNFKRKISGEFFILKCLKHHAIFLHVKTNKFYAVKALGDPFDIMLPFFPAIVMATILPFKDKIIYDGFLYQHSVNIYVGSNMRRELNEQYQQAKKEGKIITSLSKKFKVISLFEK